MMPDYHIEPEPLIVNPRLDPSQIEEGIHPLETMAKTLRAKNDIYAQLKDNQVLLTNLPPNFNNEYQELADIPAFLHKNVHRDLDILNVEVIDSLGTVGMREKTAYIKVTVGNKRQVEMVRKQLRKTWVSDCLLKVKTPNDAKKEHFNNRTVLIQNIPNYMSTEKVIEVFGQKAGKIVGIELPMQNLKLKELRNAIQDQKDMPKSIDREEQYRRAQIVIQQNLDVDREYQNTLVDLYGEEGAKDMLEKKNVNEAPSILQGERINSLIRLVTHLQAEGKNVLHAKLTLLELQKKAQTEASSVHGAQSAETTEDALKKSLESNSKEVGEILGYLQKNNDKLSIKLGDEPLQDLLKLSKGELSLAYDTLIDALGDRENAIEGRLRASVEHFGMEERILLEKKDFRRELEDIENVKQKPGDMPIESVISVNQQIQNVWKEKNMSASDKFMHLMKDTLNPFRDKNFSEDALRSTTGPNMDVLKEHDIPDPRIAKSLGDMYYAGSDFKEEHKDYIENLITGLRDSMDLPFDELYHKEKQMIQNVIDAEKALEKKISTLPDPLDVMRIDESRLNPEQKREYQTILEQFSSPFEQSRDRKKKTMVNERLRDLQTQNETGSYRFDYSENNDINALIESGQISGTQAAKMRKLVQEGQEENLGYVFLTFSHSDEARLFLMENQKAFFDHTPLEVSLKSKLDHTELDQAYFLAKARNDAKTFEEISRVREARRELREFEAEMDKQMPSRKKLKAARNMMRSLVEDNKYNNRAHQSAQILTELEKDKFDRNAKEMEAAYPHLDLTTLYENDDTEGVRQVLHKKAYASYKAFQFLKHGVKRSKEEEPKLSSSKQRLIDNDPYNFPELDQTVHSVLNDSVRVPRLNDHGDMIMKPGRRNNGYTEQEYLDSFFGPDMARRQTTEVLEDKVWKTQSRMKDRFPAKSFLKMPAINAKQKRLDDLGLNNDPYQFPNLRVQDTQVADIFEERGRSHPGVYNDIPHPDGGKKTYLDESSKMMEKYMAAREKAGINGEGKIETIGYKDMAYMSRKLDEEFKVGRFSEPDWFKVLRDDQRKPEYRWQDLLKRQEKGMFAKDGFLHGDDPKRDMAKRKRSFQDQTEETKEPGAGGDETQGAKFEPAYNKGKKEDNQQVVVDDEGQPLTEDQQLINNEYFYKMKLNPKSVKYPGLKLNEKTDEVMEAMNNFAQGYDEETIKRNRAKKDNEGVKQETLESLQDYTRVSTAPREYGGSWFRKYKTGIDEIEMKQDKFKESARPGKKLEQFYEEGGESEREDDDIYQHYQEMMSRRQEQETSQDHLHLDKDDLQPEMPRFDSYFESKSKQMHPFEKIKDSFNESDIRDDAEAEYERQRDQELHQRELLGRLMGQSLTPRQFELLTGIGKSGEIQTQRMLDNQNKQFLSKQDQIRLWQEHFEKMRRQKIKSGEWTEENSMQELQNHLEEEEEKQMTSHEKKKYYRHLDEVMLQYRNLDNPENLLVKEYHFDETCGLSLSDHISDLKTKYPDGKVETRRDRDGFAIIKISHEQEFKYNLDHAINYDLEAEQQRVAETMEIILQSMLPSGTNINDFANLSQEELSEKLNVQLGQKYDLTYTSKLQVEELMKERASGRYMDDKDGFTQAFNDLLSDLQYDQSKPLKNTTLLDSFIGGDQSNLMEQVTDEIYNEREVFRQEIAQQLTKKINKHINHTKRKTTDFIKPKTSETSVYAQQQISVANSIDSLKNKKDEMEEEEDFDKEAYKKLKEELSERREAKQRLLDQGLPQFNAYLRF